MPQHAALDGPSGHPTPHFVLLPLFAPGHMIPMVDITHLLAERGVTVSLITTPLNAARTRAAIDRAQASGLPISFVELPFPCAELGLPEGCECLDLVPSLDVGVQFFRGVGVLRAPLVAYLRQQRLPPSCIISDICHPWTRGVADEFGIPRLIFHGTCCFALLCDHNIRQQKVYDNNLEEDDMKPFVVQGLPHRMEITRDQAPGFFRAPGLEKHRSEIIEAEETSDGIVFNSFHELEPLYLDSYQKATGKKAWAIGPVCLYNNRDVADRAARGSKAPLDNNCCLNWLDAMKPGSVVFVNFGSLTRITPSQIIEIGMGLEASGHPFIWVIKTAEHSLEVEKWLLEEGFHERTKGRSLVVRGWAPQAAILSHPAVGGFVSHCGWNSSLEAISAGVPMVTWPYFAEQFINERLILDVLRVGVPIGVKKQTKWKREQLGELVQRQVVEEAVRKLMDGGVEGQERRERARLLGEQARKAMEVGGSSYENMTHLVREMSLRHANAGNKTSARTSKE